MHHILRRCSHSGTWQARIPAPGRRVPGRVWREEALAPRCTAGRVLTCTCTSVGAERPLCRSAFPAAGTILAHFVPAHGREEKELTGGANNVPRPRLSGPRNPHQASQRSGSNETEQKLSGSRPSVRPSPDLFRDDRSSGLFLASSLSPLPLSRVSSAIAQGRYVAERTEHTLSSPVFFSRGKPLITGSVYDRGVGAAERGGAKVGADGLTVRVTAAPHSPRKLENSCPKRAGTAPPGRPAGRWSGERRVERLLVEHTFPQTSTDLKTVGCCCVLVFSPPPRPPPCHRGCEPWKKKKEAKGRYATPQALPGPVSCRIARFIFLVVTGRTRPFCRQIRAVYNTV